MIDYSFQTWFRQIKNTVSGPQKRQQPAISRWGSAFEDLESRLVLSAMSSELVNPEVVEIATAIPRSETSNLNGNWTINVAFPGGTPVSATGTIQAEGRKIQGKFSLANGSPIEFKGKISNSNPSHVNGRFKAEDPIPKGKFTLVMNAEAPNQFSGTLNAKRGGTATLTGTKDAVPAPVARKAVTFPNVAGVWNLNVNANIDGDESVYTGQVTITQKKGKITGAVKLQDLPDFEFKGKLSKSDPLNLNGKSKIPIDLGDGDFRFIRGVLNANFNQNLLTFTGDVSRSIFGHDIKLDITAQKQA